MCSTPLRIAAIQPIRRPGPVADNLRQYQHKKRWVELARRAMQKDAQ
ncbi:MAG: hypothetical protein PVI97_13600 [Candidatus Thiodiazotropha sp.]|jgi:hypothetical protein